jgi:hypothetical protein
MIFLMNSSQLRHGPSVNQLGKLETKAPADLAGLSELLRPCQIVSALPVDKLFKLESQLKIFFRAVELVAVTDAMVAIPQELSAGGKTLELSLEDCTKILSGAIPMLSPLAITTSAVNTDPAEPVSPLPNAPKNALVDIPKPTVQTKSMLNPSTAFLPKWPKSRLRS